MLVNWSGSRREADLDFSAATQCFAKTVSPQKVGANKVEHRPDAIDGVRYGHFTKSAIYVSEGNIALRADKL